MSSIRRSLLYSAASGYYERIVNFILIIFISRLLTPSEVGTFAIAASITLVFSELKLFGIGNYIIKKDHIDDIDVKRALAGSISISWSLGVFLFISAFSISNFYKESDLQYLIFLLSAPFFISPHIGIGISLLIRNFQFKERFIINLIAQSFKALITIFLLYQDYSYYSMAIALNISVLIELLMLSIIKPNHYTLIPKFNSLSHVLSFGAFVSIGNMLRKLSISVPDLIIGRVGSTSDVAIFSRGLGLLNFLSVTFSQAARPVTAPYLADIKRRGLDIESSYNTANLLIGSILLPVVVVAGIASHPLIYGLFGEQWLASVELVEIMSFWAAIKAYTIFTPALLITLDHHKSLFFRELAIFIFLSIAIYLSYPHGLKVVAYIFVNAAILEALITVFMLRNLLGFSLRKSLISYSHNFFILGACLLATILFNLIWDFETSPPITTLLLLGLINASIWTASIIFTNHPIYKLIKIK